MPQAAPLLAYYGAQFVLGTGVIGTTVALGASLAASYAVGQYQGRKAARQQRAAYEASLRDRAQTFRSADAPRITVYGRQLVSGPHLFVPFASGEHDQFLHAGVILASHRINAVRAIRINGEDIGALDAQGRVQPGSKYWKSKRELTGETLTANAQGQATLSRDPATTDEVFAFIRGGGSADSYVPDALVPVSVSGRTVSGLTPNQQATIQYSVDNGKPLVRVIVHHGADDQTADAELIAVSGGAWTAAHRVRGIAWLHVVCEYDAEIFAQGLNTIAAEVEGKLLFDPRDGGTRYSDNWALVVRDYLASQSYGFRATQIDDASVIAAANASDELIALRPGGPRPGQMVTQRRYTACGTVSWEADRRETLEDLRDAAAGRIDYIGTRWYIRAGVYEPPVMNLGESDLADGETQGQAFAPRSDLFNSVRGVYVDPWRDWVTTDYPPYRSATYIGQDGGREHWRDIAQPFCDDHERAQRVAKLHLHRARQAVTIKAPFKLRAARLMAGNRIRFTLDRRGWANKVFEILQSESDPINGKVWLTLQEDAPEVYHWQFDESITPDPAPNTNLPNPFDVPVLVNLRASSGAEFVDRLGDGTLVSHVLVQWDAVQDVTVTQGGRIQVRYRLAFDPDWRPVAEVDGDAAQVRIGPVAPDTPMLIQGRAHNGIAGGPWRTISHVVSAEAPGTIGEVLWQNITGAGKPEDNATRVQQYNQVAEPTDAPPNALWYRPDTGALYRRPVSGVGWILVSTVGADASTLQAGIGANLLANAGMSKGAQGFAHVWNPTGAMTLSWMGEGADPWSGNYRPRPMGGLRYGGPAQPFGAALGAWVSDPVPVQPGTRVEAQIRVCSHRVSQQLRVAFYDAADTLLFEVTVGGGVPSNDRGFQSWDDAALLWGFIDPAAFPPGSVSMRLMVQHFSSWLPGDPATNDGFAFKPFLGYAHSGQTQPSPWVDGSPRGALAQFDRAATIASTSAGEQASSNSLVLVVNLPESAVCTIAAEVVANVFGVGASNLPPNVLLNFGATHAIYEIGADNHPVRHLAQRTFFNTSVTHSTPGETTWSVVPGALSADVVLPAGVSRFRVDTISSTASGPSLFRSLSQTVAIPKFSATLAYR